MLYAKMVQSYKKELECANFVLKNYGLKQFFVVAEHGK